jgi:hypothetical protein
MRVKKIDIMTGFMNGVLTGQQLNISMQCIKEQQYTWAALLLASATIWGVITYMQAKKAVGEYNQYIERLEDEADCCGEEIEQ